MKIVLDGAYGFENVGDEAMLHTAIGVLRKSNPRIDIYVSSYKPERIRELHGIEGTRLLLPGALLRNLKRLNLRAFFNQLDFIRHSDVLVFAGGSILNDKKGLRNIFVIFYKVLMFRLFSKKVIFWGVAFDQVRSFFARKMINIIMRSATLVIFRDELSSELMARQLGECRHIGSGVDILFSLLPTLGKSSSRGLRKNNCDSYKIGLSLRFYPPNTGFDLEALDSSLCEQIAKYISTLPEDSGKNIIVVPLVFSSGDGARNDTEMISRVEGLCHGVLFEWPGLDITSCENAGFEALLNEYCELISSLDLVVGERFHSLVLAQILGVPSIAISYDNKVDELVKLTGMTTYSLDLLKSVNEQTICAQLLSMTGQVLSSGMGLAKIIEANNWVLEEKSIENQSRLLSALN